MTGTTEFYVEWAKIFKDRAGMDRYLRSGFMVYRGERNTEKSLGLSI